MKKLGRTLIDKTLTGLETSGVDVNHLSSYADKATDVLGNTFSGPLAFVLGCFTLGGLWMSLVVSSILLWVFWPLLIVCGGITAFNLLVARCFTNVDDVKNRAYPRMLAGLSAQVVLGVPFYLLGPPFIVIGSLAALMVSSSIFLALSVALLIAVVSTFNNVYAHAGTGTGSDTPNAPSTSASANGGRHSSFPASQPFTLASSGLSGEPHNGAGAGAGAEAHELEEQGEVLIPQSGPSGYALAASGPMAIFSQYPLLLLVLAAAPVLSALLIFLLLFSPYWMVWWYVSTPIFFTGFILVEVVLVSLYYSRLVSQSVYQRVSSATARTYRFLYATARGITVFVQEKIKAGIQSYRLHSEQRKRRKQMQFVAVANPPSSRPRQAAEPEPEAEAELPRSASPQPSSPRHQDENPNGGSLASSRRDSRAEFEGEIQPQSQQPDIPAPAPAPAPASAEHATEQKETEKTQKRKKKNT